MEGSTLSAGEAEFLTERLQLILLSILPESERYRALDGALELILKEYRRLRVALKR
ncbi:MAG: hypothetical protein HY247_02990 [archaeon]|nr:MAG: hypothetical protein HY247_02990 [archaeon]